MGFKRSEVDKLLADTGRRCCICSTLHAVQIHHIKSLKDGGNDDIDNAIPLCPNCHNQVHSVSSSRLTRCFSADELVSHRERTIKLVQASFESSFTYHKEVKPLSRPEKLDRLKRNQAIKEQLIQKLGLSPQWPLKESLEALIRNVDRVEEYPEEKIKMPKNEWPFFKTEIRGMYHDGIEFYNSIVSIKETPHGLFVDYSGGGGAYQIARIPFDWIEYIDFDGDEFDFYPHIFCRFENNGLPYREYRISRMIIRNGRVEGDINLGKLGLNGEIL